MPSQLAMRLSFASHRDFFLISLLKSVRPSVRRCEEFHDQHFAPSVVRLSPPVDGYQRGYHKKPERTHDGYQRDFHQPEQTPEGYQRGYHKLKQTPMRIYVVISI
jgi:hypothetical protein